MTDAMAVLERQARAPVGFVAASAPAKASKVIHGQLAAVAVENPDALNIDLDDR